MIDPGSPETLSAYIDGELTDEERRRVEAHLASSPESRRLVDELRTLSAVVGELPRHASTRDLAAAAVDRAHTRRSDQAPDNQETTRLRRRGAGGDARRFGRFLRPALWSGLTVAAAMLVMVLSDGTDDVHRTLTQRPTQSPSSPANAPPRALEELSDHKAKPGDVEQPARDDAAALAADEVTRPGTPSETAEMAPAQLRPRGERRAAGQAGTDLTVESAAPRKPASTMTRGSSPSSSADAPIVIIQATLRGGADPHAVRSLVARQGIAWQDQPRPPRRIDSLQAADRQAREALSLFERVSEKNMLHRQKVVYVEATIGQIEAMLAELEDSPEQWTDVSVRRLPVGEFLARQRETVAEADVASESAGVARASKRILTFGAETNGPPGAPLFARTGEDADPGDVARRQEFSFTLPELQQEPAEESKGAAHTPNWRSTARVLTPETPLEDRGADGRSNIDPQSEAIAARRGSVATPTAPATGRPPPKTVPAEPIPQPASAPEKESARRPESSRGRAPIPVRVLLVIQRSGDESSAPEPAPANP